jgi:hypothetical protein
MSGQVLIESSIAQLQQLSTFLADELGELSGRSAAATVEARACKEILLSITVLLPKLHAARYVVGEGEDVGRCTACEDG